MKETTMYAIKWELKNYDNLDEKTKKCNDKLHYDRNFSKGCIRTFKTKEAAERRAAKYRALNNNEWLITVVEYEQ